MFDLMNTRYKIGYISELSYGPKVREQREMLLDYGVEPANIFAAPSGTALDACNACRPQSGDLLVVAFVRVIAKEWGAVITALDEKGADLHCVADERTYKCKNGATFGKLKANMDKGQTLAARASKTRDNQGGRPNALTDKQMLQAEQRILRGESISVLCIKYGVAENYFSRRKITRKSVQAKYDK